MSERQRQQFIDRLNAAPLPSLGDPANVYEFALTEPEINAIHTAMAFVRSACAAAGLTAFWEHYGPTLETLSKRLARIEECCCGHPWEQHGDGYTRCAAAGCDCFNFCDCHLSGIALEAHAARNKEPN